MSLIKSENNSYPRSPVGGATTEDFVKEMQQGNNNILVAVRCRPFTNQEIQRDPTPAVHILDEKFLVISPPNSEFNSKKFRLQEKQYTYDYVFNEISSQQEIYNKTTEFLLKGVLEGYNATVFAYGATGAGKTFTMLGEAHSPGLMLMTLGGLFSLVEELSLERDYQVKLSYLEIYNEVIRDLLNPSKSMLDIREDPAKGVMVANLTEIMPNTPEEVVDSIRKGNKRRTCEPTEANKTSSRSHAVLQIFVQQRDKAYDINSEVAVGKLSLIDLAGSERASNTKNRGMRLIEGANINKSLLSLANCINALCDANEKGSKVHIPYRDSKLTRLLKDSLGGNCRTVMVACISPYSGTYEDTHNTLEYANRAKNIKTKLQRNVVNVSHHISKYTVIISELRKEISHLRKSLKDSKTPALNSTTTLNKKLNSGSPYTKLKCKRLNLSSNCSTNN